MLNILIAMAGILITILFVIGTHEAAHFYAARWLGVKTLTFSIGFGKALFRWHDRLGTEYIIAMIPLGGYVRMLDETEGPVAEEEKHLAINRQPFYKKFLIVLAGPLANIFCAFILYWLIFVMGFVTIKPMIGEVKPHSIAAQGGLEANQVIRAIDQTPTATWTNVLFRLLAHLGNQDQIDIATSDLNNGKIKSYRLDLTHWRVDDLSPDPLASLGIVPFEPKIPLIIGIIATESPALSSSLKIGDEIIAVDGKPVQNWQELTKIVLASPGKTFQFTVNRDQDVTQLPVKIGSQWGLFKQTGYLGISPKFVVPKEMLHKVQYGPIEALGFAWQEMLDFTYFNVLLFGKLLTGKLSLQSLGGPITIFESAGTALNYGFLSFIAFLAFLSISIGIINLIPIPGLDGGHLVIQTIEAILGRPIPIAVLNLLFRLGFIFLFVILFQALMNDILRLY